jgi:GxxExxY protein
MRRSPGACRFPPDRPGASNQGGTAIQVSIAPGPAVNSGPGAICFFVRRGLTTEDTEITEKKMRRRLKVMDEKQTYVHDPLTERVIGCAIEVHRELGPGLLESAYEECLAFELREKGIRHARQVQLPVQYKGIRIESGYRIDLLVEERLIVELKSVEKFMPVHTAQILSYMRLASIRTGLLINFNVPFLKEGLQRKAL